MKIWPNHFYTTWNKQDWNTDSPPTPPPWRWLKMDIEFYPVVQECKKKTIFKYHHQEICQFFFFFPKVKICFHEESGRASATALMTGMIEDFAGGSAIRTCLPMQETQVWSWVRKIPWIRKWQLTPVLLPGKFHGQRNLESTVLGVTKESAWLSN